MHLRNEYHFVDIADYWHAMQLQSSWMLAVLGPDHLFAHFSEDPTFRFLTASSTKKADVVAERAAKALSPKVSRQLLAVGDSEVSACSVHLLSAVAPSLRPPPLWPPPPLHRVVPSPCHASRAHRRSCGICRRRPLYSAAHFAFTLAPH